MADQACGEQPERSDNPAVIRKE